MQATVGWLLDLRVPNEGPVHFEPFVVLRLETQGAQYPLIEEYALNDNGFPILI